MLFLIEAPADAEDLQAMSDAGSLGKGGAISSGDSLQQAKLCQSSVYALEAPKRQVRI